MNDNLRRVCILAERQHGAVAVWQMRRLLRMTRGEVGAATRSLVKAYRGVYAMRDLDELGWYRAATLALGARAVISHLSALMLLELRPYELHDIHVSLPGNGGRARREDIQVHRPRRAMETGTCHAIPVTSPSQSLVDAALEPHELYRAIEEAERLGYALTLPLNGMFELRHRVRGRTKSDAEARFLLLCAQQSWPLPLVNHRLNGFETDFHWPRERLVVEVDGWEFHRDRAQFEEDRRRTLVHGAAGWTVLRPSAVHGAQPPRAVLDAIRGVTGWCRSPQATPARGR